MNEMKPINLKSNRTNKTYEAQVYEVEQDGGKTLVVSHRSLEKIFWSLPDDDRPSFDVQPFDLEKMPGIPPMFAVKCKLEKDGVCVEQIGELLCMDWQNKSTISKQFPLTICKNQAFDRAFIRYMQFDISMYETASILYSSSEINVPKEAMIPVTSKTLDSEPSYSIPTNEWSGTEETDDDGVNTVSNINTVTPAAEVKTSAFSPSSRISADAVSDAIRNAMNETDNTSANTTANTPAAPAAPYKSQTADSAPASNRAGAASEMKPDSMAQPAKRQTRQNTPVQNVPSHNAPVRNTHVQNTPAQNATLKQNETPKQSVTQNQAMAPKRKLRVTKVVNDQNYPRTLLQTDIGVIAFNPQTKLFFSNPNIDLDQVDLNHIYNQASSLVKMDLAQFANAR